MKQRLQPAAIALVASLATLAACAGDGNTPGTPTRPPQSALAAADSAAAAQATVLLEQLQRVIGNAACDDNVQCHTLAVGQRACGGPQAYLAWSDKGGDAPRLNALAESQRAAATRALQRSGGVSTCQIEIDPGAVCSSPVAGGPRSCQLGRPASAGSIAR